MGLFKALVRTTINTVILPAKIAKDIAMAPVRFADDEPILKDTSKQIETIKDESDTDD